MLAGWRFCRVTMGLWALSLWLCWSLWLGAKDWSAAHLAITKNRDMAAWGLRYEGNTWQRICHICAQIISCTAVAELVQVWQNMFAVCPRSSTDELGTGQIKEYVQRLLCLRQFVERAVTDLCTCNYGWVGLTRKRQEERKIFWEWIWNFGDEQNL